MKKIKTTCSECGKPIEVKPDSFNIYYCKKCEKKIEKRMLKQVKPYLIAVDKFTMFWRRVIHGEE